MHSQTEPGHHAAAELQMAIASVSHGRPIGYRVSSSMMNTPAFVWSIWTTSRGAGGTERPGNGRRCIHDLLFAASPGTLLEVDVKRATIVRRCGGFSPADMQFVCTSGPAARLLAGFASVACVDRRADNLVPLLIQGRKTLRASAFAIHQRPAGADSLISR